MAGNADAPDPNAGTFPEVVDEAGNSWPWLPVVGLLVVVIMSGYVFWAARAALGSELPEDSAAGELEGHSR